MDRCPWIQEDIIKSDQEPAIVALRAEIVGTSRTEMVPEFSPVKDSKANGVAENAVKEMAGMVRTLKDYVEAKMQEPLKEDDAMLLWIIDYAGTVITRSKIGPDGRTAYQRLKGKSPSNQVTAIGEKVLYMPVKKSGTRLNKLAPKFKCGIWLGISARTSESIIGTSEGVFRARVVRRLVPSLRWDAGMIKAIKGTPWDPISSEKLSVNMEENAEQPKDAPAPPEAEMKFPRRLKITKDDIRRFGYTPGCQGLCSDCSSKDCARPQ